MDEIIASKLDAFFGQYAERQAAKGTTLIYGHQNPPGVIRLLQGTVGQYDIGTGGQKLVVNIFRPGAFFPMAWAINKTPNTYFFEALDNVTYQVAPPDDTITFLLQNPDVLLSLLSRVYKGTDGVLQRMTYLMAGDARARLLFELFTVCQRFGQKRSKDSCVVQIRESDLAAYTGLSRETVSRLLQKMKDEGLLWQQRGKITIRHFDKLERLIGLG